MHRQAESEATPSEVYREHVQDLLRAIVAPNGSDRSVPVIATPSVATVEASEQEDQQFADAQDVCWGNRLSASVPHVLQHVDVSACLGLSGWCWMFFLFAIGWWSST